MKYRILVIDDDPDINSLVENILRRDFEVYSTTNPVKAVENLDIIEPDIVIVDIMMPLMDGREVSRRIRFHPQFSQTPIIFLSVLTERNIIIETYKAGADLYLTKPFTPNRLLDSIRAFLQRKIIPVKKKKYDVYKLKNMLRKPQKPPEKEKFEKPKPAAEKKEPLQVKITPPKKEKTPPPEAPKVSKPHREEKPVAAESSPDKAADKKPAGVAADPVKPKPAKPTSTKGERKVCDLPRILVADDDKELLEMLQISLGDKYELFTVENGMILLKEAEFLEPDLFIIDAMMPRFSGYQVCQVLKKSEHFRDAPIIMISAKASKKDVEYVKKIGVKAFVAKPFTFMQMDNAIVKILNTPFFEIKPKLHTYDEILKIKEFESAKKERKEKERTHRRTKNVMSEFLRNNPHYK